ncbi:MAG: GNAT family N-acetyltransferase [Betaproteobacteria bacterium]|nr:GNAT family N-acetyltransferase [Betaproteobacteria bacterium]
MSKRNIRVEEVTIADTDEVAVLIGKLLGEIMQVIGENVFDFDCGRSANQLRQFLDMGRYNAFIARNHAERIIGVITLSESCALYAGGRFGTIPEFYVEPEYRSQGVGSALADAARAHARSCAWSRLEVTTPPLPQFERTLAFYEAQGFSLAGGRKLKWEVQP